MRVVIFNADYDSFLNSHYLRNPDLANASFEEQRQSRLNTLYGVSGAYSRAFRALGHEAEELFVNNIWMQTAWAREHGMAVPVPPPPTATQLENSNLVTWMKRTLRPYRAALTPLARKMGFLLTLTPLERKILLTQIEQINPDIILNAELQTVDSALMMAVRRPGRTIIAQCGNQPPHDFDPTPYTFGISLIPAVVEIFRANGLRAENRHLAFDPSVLEKLPPAPPKDIDVSFVGGLASNHTGRIALLEAVAREIPIDLYLSNFKGLPKSSPLHAQMRGEVWGRDMYDVLRRSKITLNSHIDAAQGMAGNMRLYEATGVGTFLLTDNLANLPTLFQPGVHVGVYDSPADCVAKIKYFLAHDAEREAIAEAGQVHTLEQHSYRNRIEEILRLSETYGM